MQQLPPHSSPNPLDRFMHLLGAGVVGILTFILLLPIILITLPYVFYIRWKIKRQMRQLAEQMQSAFGDIEGMVAGMGQTPTQPDGSGIEDDAPAGTRGRKHVDVKVKTVGFEDNAPDTEA